MIPLTPPFRPAEARDAAAVAFLFNEAASGIPLAMWSAAAESDAEPGDEPWAIGAARMTARMQEATTIVLDEGAGAVASLLGYPIHAAREIGPDVPAAFAPLIELENLAAPSWYVNALAAMPEARGRGLGARLLAVAGDVARAEGLDALSLIASDVNAGAIRLYRRLGFEVGAARPQLPVAGWTPKGRDWLLMIRRGLG